MRYPQRMWRIRLWEMLPLALLVVGALASNSATPAAIASAVASANSATAPYTNMIVNGYNNSSTAAAYTSYLASNANFADAIVSG